MNLLFPLRTCCLRHVCHTCHNYHGIEVLAKPNLHFSTSAFQGALYGMAQSIPDRSLVSELACGYLDAYYSTDKLKPPPAKNGVAKNGSVKNGAVKH